MVWQVRAYTPEDIEWLAERGLIPETDPSVCADPPDPSLPRMWFNAVPEPKVGKVRIHVDVNAPGPHTTQELLDRGARIVEVRPGGERWTVIADPEGNEFCLFGVNEQE